MTRPSTLALIVAGGRGSRAGQGVPKQYRPLGGIPVLRRTVLAFLRHPAIDRVRVVIHPDDRELYDAAVGDLPLLPSAMGGAARQASVSNGLAAAAGEEPDIVLIHDAARPLVTETLITRCLDAMAARDRSLGPAAVVPALPVVDSLRRGRPQLAEEIDRDGLVKVQTPQCFDGAAFLEVHARAATDREFTDDAAMAMAAGWAVDTVEGEETNLKLTTEADFARAEAEIAARLVTRTGLGFDVHAFAEGEQLWLGGILIPHPRGLSGHSDADVVLHALTDALLGAAGAGDIGDHFPPNDPQWRGAASSRFVEHARDLIAGRGGIIDHADITIICEAPRIGPHRQAMREHIAGLLRLPLPRISIKATTSERLGFTGRGEGIAAQAAATIRMGNEQ